MEKIPASHQDLFDDGIGAYAYLATLMKDGSPQLTPLWFDTEGEYIRINTAKGRIKERNMRLRPNVAILIVDPKEPFYRFVQIRGFVSEFTEQGADEHINRLCLKYDKKPWTVVPGQVRVIYKIQPRTVFASG
jgi:PPOX class probable F420-dependent enzyme